MISPYSGDPALPSETPHVFGGCRNRILPESLNDVKSMLLGYCSGFWTIILLTVRVQVLLMHKKEGGNRRLLGSWFRA